MRHAICVIGYGTQADVLQNTINILDNPDIDFFIHWDKRFKLPKLSSLNSNIYYLNNRIAVHWGSDSQIKATLLLLRRVKKSNTYDYVHLISSADIPLMTSDYFKNYFKNDTYIGFDNKFTYKEAVSRIGYLYPDIDFRKHKICTSVIQRCNKLLKINRIKNFKNIKKGPNWFSIKTKYIDEILNSNLNMFMHSYCADEIWVQTILEKFESKQINTESDNAQALRYIDWNRGTPYVFTRQDIDVLKSCINTNYAFARKIYDPGIARQIFDI